MLKRATLACLAALIAAPAVASEEVNVYSYRQPELIKPLTDAFTDQSGIKVNVVFLAKGLIERLKSEGRRSPADLIFTVDISRLAGVVDADLTQPVESEVLIREHSRRNARRGQSLVRCDRAGAGGLCPQGPRCRWRSDDLRGPC